MMNVTDETSPCHIAMIQLDGIGKEIIDKESNGTLGPPIQMSFLGCL